MMYSSRFIRFVRGRSLNLWILLAALVSLVSFIVDRTTGAKTGPPYNDSLINKAALFVFFISIPTLLALGLLALARYLRRR